MNVWIVVGGVAVLVYLAQQAGILPSNGNNGQGADASAAASASAAARPRPTGASSPLLPAPSALTFAARDTGPAMVVPMAAHPASAPSAFNPNVAGPISAPVVNAQLPAYVDATYISTQPGTPTQPGDAGVEGIPIAVAPDIPAVVAAPQDAPAPVEQVNYEPLPI